MEVYKEKHQEGEFEDNTYSVYRVCFGGSRRKEEKKIPIWGCCCHLKACNACQGWDRSKFIAAPICLMTSCGEKKNQWSNMRVSPLSVAFVSSRPP